MVAADFIKIFDLGDIGKSLEQDFLISSQLSGMNPYGEVTGDKKTWLATREFTAPKINLYLGQLLEAQLPPEAKEALKHLSLGEPPHVVILRGMPTGKSGHDKPESGMPLCAFSLRAVSALLGKQDAPFWEQAKYSQRFNFDSYRNKGVQPLHSDYVLRDEDIDTYGENRPLTNQVFSALHCVTADPLTPTYFVPYSPERAKTLPDPEKDPYVIMQPGDVVIFNNLKVLHARGAQLPQPAGSKPLPEQERHIIAINVTVPYRDLGQDLATAAIRR